MSVSEMWSNDSVKVAPDHVPVELVRSIDLWNKPADGECPFGQVARVQAENPRIFYNLIDPQCGSSWVLTREEELRQVFTDPETFSSNGTASLSALIGESWPLNPLEIDPPAHRHFRAILNRFFLPSAVARLDEGVRARAVSLIEGFKDEGGCEFMEAFGTPFPVGVFLHLMGLPAEDQDMLVAWNNALNHDTAIAEKVGGAKAIRDYLVDLREQRRKNPTDDLGGYIAKAEIDGKKLTDDDVLGMYFLTLIAGLDTVASSLSNFFRHLAVHPEQQEQLRRAPERVPHAVEEMMRAFSPVMTRRKATRDTELADVKILKGDWVTCITSFAGQDPDRYANATAIDFERQNNRHLAFASGPHACAGVHLARREMQIALTEWGRRVPIFALKPGKQAPMKNGGVIGALALDLIW